MKPIRILIAVCCAALCAPWAAAQSLVYMVTTGTTTASFRAKFPNGIFGTTPEQRLAMLRRTDKNQIWSVSMADGKRTLLFSDEGMSNFEIVSATDTSSALLASGKALVRGVERSWRGQPNPGAIETPRGIYEVSLDGTKRFRRLIDAKPNMGPLMLTSDGAKAAVDSLDPASNKYTLDVYSLPQWKLLRTVDLSKAFEAHCPDCLVQSGGWLADGKSLYFDVQPRDEEGEDASPNQVPGNYIISDEGLDAGRIPREAGRVKMAGYERLNSFGASVVAQLANGNYVFCDYALKTNPRPKPPAEYERFLVITDSQFHVLKQFPIGRLRTSGYVLAANGKSIAYVEDRMTPDYRTECRVWTMDLVTGAAKEVFSTPPPNPPPSPEPSKSVFILGWMDK
ncbi:MAG TPA: hypothetical protein VJN21_11780 [Candidatus Acidoferrales bacterium]|nr:hypothetical protein [Candidatus Acidoferrales bacterium]